MAGFGQFDEGIIAGARIEDEDINSSAAINPLKVKADTLVVPIQLGNAILSASNATKGISTSFPQIALSNSGDSYFICSFGSLGEMIPGAAPRLHVWWTSSATSGVFRIVADIRSVRENSLSLTSFAQRLRLSTANATANRLTEMDVLFPSSLFNNNQVWSLKIAREPGNTHDTLAATANIHAVYLTMDGKC